MGGGGFGGGEGVFQSRMGGELCSGVVGLSEAAQAVS